MSAQGRSIEIHAALCQPPPPPRTKVCTKCGVRKPLSMFYANSRQLTDGRRSDCIRCFGARVKARDEIRRGERRWLYPLSVSW